MIILPLQWDKFSGPDAIGQNKLIFTMDESVNPGTFNPLRLKKGKQFLVILLETDSEQNEFAQESQAETTTRFKKRMEALIAERGIDREEFKQRLKNIGLIRESTNELDLIGYTKAIAQLL